jgi:steroid delta-isomerase-like uncharacterized protein
MPTPADTARSIFDALTKRDLDQAMSYDADDAVDDFVAIGEFRGKRAIRDFFEQLLTAFPDFEVTVHRIVGDDQAAVVQWTATGTFTGGPFQGIQPTGKHVEVRGVDFMEFADGRLRHNTIYYDGASFARQVGLLPRAGSGPDRAILAAFNAVTQVRQRREERAGRRVPRM